MLIHKNLYSFSNHIYVGHHFTPAIFLIATYYTS